MSNDLVCHIAESAVQSHIYIHSTYSASSGYGPEWSGASKKFPTLKTAIRWHNANCESEWGLTIDIPEENEVTINDQAELDYPDLDHLVVSTFSRISFKVQAIKVQKDNMKQIAKWCGGRVSTTKDGVPFVEIPVGKNPKINRNRAFESYWVVTGKNGTYFSYSDRAFRSTFESI